MAFKRALWHSGLTYKRECEGCRTIVQYTDHSLDFRPWFPDGFVYCPKCKKPLRHSETYAINRGGQPQESYVLQNGASLPAQDTAASEPSPGATESPSPTRAKFCGGCGKPFGEDDLFCVSCGRKR